MKKIFTIILIMLIMPVILLSQNLKPSFDDFFLEKKASVEDYHHLGDHQYCNHHLKDIKHIESLQDTQYETNIKRRKYDAIRYDLFFDWYNLLKGPDDTLMSRRYNAINNICLVIDSNNVQYITFDAVEMQNIHIHLGYSDVSFDYDGIKLTIDLGQEYKQGDTLDLSIEYEAIVSEKGGAYLYKKVGQYSEKLIYTQSEADDARKWWICNDRTYDKAMISTTIKVPNEYVASSNGTMNKIVKTDTTWEYHFSSAYPMVTYLVVANASKFYYEQKPYKSIISGRDIPLNYYFWACDADTSTNPLGYSAATSLNKDTILMRICENLFGEYPFESYGVTAVNPYMFGGMEHQTMTTIHRNWLKGRSLTGLIHELGHQWLGDKITCATWNDIWINEGGASWTEAFIYEHYYGKERYYAYMLNHKRTYIARKHFNTPIYYIPHGAWFGAYYDLAYKKASWIYHMLYMWTDGDFTNSLKGILDKYAYQSVETKDFIEGLKSQNFVFPIDIDTFFEQWVFSAGHPIYDLTGDWKYTDDTEEEIRVTAFIKQIQEGENIPEIFDAMQKVIVFNKTEQDTFLIRNNSKEQYEYFTINFEPQGFYLDQSYTLMQSDTAQLAFNYISEAIESSISLYPNPVSNKNYAKLQFRTNKPAFISIDLYDAYGKLINNIDTGYYSGELNSVNIPTNGLLKGMYIVKIQIGNAITTRKLVVL